MEASDTLCDIAHLTIHEEGNVRTEFSMRQEFSGESVMRAVGPVAQRITRLTTDQKIPGSNPGRVEFFFFSHGFYMELHNACNHERENSCFGFCQILRYSFLCFVRMSIISCVKGSVYILLKC